uniref:DNA polymerase epsilon catalytic subunit n=1 Tax=Meloidogyne incognita TaxID=6306 RepID=A0A914LJI1_MELIC
MNILDWANTIVKRSVQHFFICFTYLKEYWSFSSYLEIPIGNLPEDLPSFGLDILFARQLKTKNYLLWASPSFIPDFGGKDLDDLRLSNEWENCSFTGKCFGGGGENYLINKEIFEAHYITAEISIGALAVTALLQSVKISEAEGTSEYIGFTCNKLSTLSIEELINSRVGGKYINDCIAVNGELACLREMFHRLVRDIHYRKNLIADQLVINMHRWICDPNSLLFNPAIKNALTILMKKLCLLLVAEMQRLGAKVIYCSFRKIVFSTQRHSLHLAKSFVNSLLIEINQKQIFASLQLGLIHFSSVLLWIDSSNHAYVYASDDEKKNGRVEAKFGLANKIQGEIKNKFIIMIAGFVGMLWNKRKEINEEVLNVSSRILVKFFS